MMNYVKFKKYYKSIMISATFILMFLIIASVAFGAANITIGDSYRIIMSRIPVINSFVSTKNIKEAYIDIILKIRLPRILLAAIVGMGLTAVGAVYQGIFKNPMADPYVLGVSSGSALGASIAIILGLDTTFAAMSGPALLAFIFAILTTFVVYNIARVGSRAPTVSLLLAGVAMSFFLSSIISMIMIVDRNQIDRIIFWTLGSFAAASWQQVEFLALVCLPLIFVILFFVRDINVILTDEETARTLGVDSEKIKRIMLAISSLIVASIVSVSGIIGFVGLIIPHSIRLVCGADNKKLIPLSVVVGAAFMIICDALARTLLSPVEIPVGAITSMFGAPYFIYLLYKSKKKVF
jgi:iron complex transport system permease protein